MRLGLYPAREVRRPRELTSSAADASCRFRTEPKRPGSFATPLRLSQRHNYPVPVIEHFRLVISQAFPHRSANRPSALPILQRLNQELHHAIVHPHMTMGRVVIGLVNPDLRVGALFVKGHRSCSPY